MCFAKRAGTITAAPRASRSRLGSRFITVRCMHAVAARRVDERHLAIKHTRTLADDGELPRFPPTGYGWFAGKTRSKKQTHVCDEDLTHHCRDCNLHGCAVSSLVGGAGPLRLDQRVR